MGAFGVGTFGNDIFGMGTSDDVTCDVSIFGGDTFEVGTSDDAACDGSSFGDDTSGGSTFGEGTFGDGTFIGRTFGWDGFLSGLASGEDGGSPLEVDCTEEQGEERISRCSTSPKILDGDP